MNTTLILLATVVTESGPNPGVVVAVVIAGLAALSLYVARHKRRYPEQVDCPPPPNGCGGSGKITSTTFLTGKTVRGTCPRCGGNAWKERGAL